MSNVKEKKFGLTCLFPIREGGTHTVQLRSYLRTMDEQVEHNLYGSPLSKVPFIHMARFAIIEDLTYQGIPARRDRLKSSYMLFMCDFDGSNADKLVAAMSEIHFPDHCPDYWMDQVWGHCVAYPRRASRDRLTAYFERCQLETNLFLADRPKDEVQDILRALICKRKFIEFLMKHQGSPADHQRAEFFKMWEQLKSFETPIVPGSV